ncbi:YolD-like family protein [Bacillus sp. CGMCC 1.16607]|uniref:YolD-like family protein n=1 Tax=Bacillus sp. CGMCC 1.16607 TaxID=3351842 RepID=UPI0036250712
MIPKPTKKTKVKRPTRDEFELEEIAELLNEAKEEKNEIVLTLWEQEPVRGVISKLDGQTKLIHVESGYQTIKVKFNDILGVSNT